MDRLFAFLIAMIVTMALIPPFTRWAGRWGVLDDPGARKVHTLPIPRIGGIAMYLGLLAPLLLWLPIDRLLGAYLAAATTLVAFGVWDDRVTLGAGAKVVGQLLAVCIIVFAGDVSIHTLTLGGYVALPAPIGTALALFFLLGITNAINLSDGLDGLAGGTTLLCCGALALLALSTDQAFVITVSVVLMGSILGFLRYNTWPARIFMGDAGSQLLGFTAGVLALVLTQDQQTVLSSALPLLLLGLPIIDTLTVMVLRLREGRSPFVADRKHLHHKLLALGFDHYEAVVVIYLLQAALILAAWRLQFESDILILAAFAAFAALITGTMLIAERSGWRWRTASLLPQSSRPARMRRWLTAPRHLPLWALHTALYCVGGYMLAVGAAADHIAPDVAWLAAILGLVLLVASTTASLGRAGTKLGWLIQAALYITAVVAIYLDHTQAIDPPLLRVAKWILLPTLVIAVVLRLRLSGERRFQATPLDALLLIVALVLPNLPGLTNTPSELGLSMAKLVVLLYSVELLFNDSSRARTTLAMLATVFLGIVAARGIL